MNSEIVNSRTADRTMKKIHTYRKDMHIYQKIDKRGYTYTRMSCAVFETRKFSLLSSRRS